MAQLAPLTFRIAKLWGSHQGTVEKHQFDQTIVYPDENLDFASNLRAELMFIKLKDEISVLLQEAKITLRSTCQLCLKKFEEIITIPAAEREFFYETPQDIEDSSDLYLINKKMMTIDLNEMVRQEIILHLPLIPVCSKGCKGLCAHCGQNKNKSKCHCKAEDLSTHKPFKDLKKMLKKA
jgi:uncharacterized protein